MVAEAICQDGRKPPVNTVGFDFRFEFFATPMIVLELNLELRQRQLISGAVRRMQAVPTAWC